MNKLRKHQKSYKQLKQTGFVDLCTMPSFQLDTTSQDFLDVAKELNNDKWLTLTDMQNPQARMILDDFVDYFGVNLLGIDDISTGLLYSGGSQANFYALAYAKQCSQKRIVLGSNLAHKSCMDACKFLDLDFKAVDLDENFQIDLASLKKSIKEYRNDIAVLYLLGGSTTLGSIDMLDDEAINLCKKYDIHVHIDAAYGAYNLGMLEGTHMQKRICTLFNIPMKKTITADPHKFIGPLGVALLFYCGFSSDHIKIEMKDYYIMNPLYHITSFSGYTPLVTLKTAQYLGLSGMKKLAHDNFAKATKLSQKLKENGFNLVNSLYSTNVSIDLGDSMMAAKVHKYLLDNCNISTSYLAIQCNLGTYYGIRIFIGGDKYYEDSDFDEIILLIKEALVS